MNSMNQYNESLGNHVMALGNHVMAFCQKHHLGKEMFLEIMNKARA